MCLLIVLFSVVISFHPDHVDITGHQSGDLPVGRLDTLALVTDYLRDIPGKNV